MILAPVLLIHGGAGTPERTDMTAERQAAFAAGLRAALEAGAALLTAGAPAEDVVQRAVEVMEDDPLFNAGRGGTLTSAGEVEHDAAIMRGHDRAAGAIASTRCIRNPIRAARLVMEKTPHVILAGKGAEDFAREQGLAFEPMSYFVTERRQAALERIRWRQALSEEDRHGTVGAVAMGTSGRLAAATSTGGRNNKMPGRVGDTPVPGAGVYADGVCALSSTGSGEQYLRTVAAHRVAMEMQLAGASLAAAMGTALTDIGSLGGSGGMIGVDAEGNAVARFSGGGMHRGLFRPGSDPATASLREDPFPVDA